MKSPFSPFRIFITLWVVFSVVYVSYDQWSDFKVYYAQKAYVTGKTETVSALIKQASNKECAAFDVYIEDTKVNLINTACLQVAPPVEEPKS
jgi:hypothetical protein